MSHCIVVNTTAVAPPVVQQLIDAANRLAPGIQVLSTGSVAEFDRFAAMAATRGVRRVIVAGGDGTVMAAVDALADSGIEIGLLPLGSGNDFSRTFGHPAEIGPALQVALGSAIVAIDVGVIHYRDEGFRSRKQRFINIAQAGFGAKIGTKADASRRWFGVSNTLKAGLLRAWRKLKTARMRLVVDGVDMGNEYTANLIVGNAQYFNRGLRPLPQARLDDGLFDVIRLRNMSRQDIARHSHAPGGIPLNHPEVDYWRARRVEATSDDPVPIEADGDLIGWLPAAFQVEPRALHLVVPPGAIRRDAPATEASGR